MTGFQTFRHFGGEQGRRKDLRCHDIAKGLGGKRSEPPAGPMGILQDAACIVRHHDPQIIAHLRIPDLWHLGDGDVAGQDGHLDFAAQDDVHVIRQFIGPDPDQPGIDGICRPPEFIGGDIAQLGGKLALQIAEVQIL